MPWVHGSSVKATAVSLQALLERRGFAGDEKAVYWLTTERKAQGRWRTTQENAASLRAFQDFYRRYEKEEPAFTASLSRGRRLRLVEREVPRPHDPARTRSSNPRPCWARAARPG